MGNSFIADTNLIIRYLTDDDEAQSPIAKAIMDKVDAGEITLLIPDVIVMELCWVLKSIYKLDRLIITNILIHLCSSEGINVESANIIEALEMFGAANVDLADAILSLKSKAQVMPIITWNGKDFAKLSCEFYKPEEVIK